MAIFGLIVLFVILAFFTGHPISMFIAGIITVIGAGILAVIQSLRGASKKLPPMEVGEKPKEYERRVKNEFSGVPDSHRLFIRQKENGNRFDKISWEEFEKLVAAYCNQLGYATTHTGGSGDEGVDIHAYSAVDRSHAIVQCKHVKSKVGSVDVQKLAGAMVAHNADSAFLVTSNEFTDQAFEFAKKVPGLHLVSGKQLEKAMEGIV